MGTVVSEVVLLPTHVAAPGAVVGFSYAELNPDVAFVAQQAAETIRTAVRSAYLDVGRQLARVKELLAHGQFRAWVEGELNLTLRSAERYMLAARFVNGKSDTVSFLPPAVLYKLAAPNAPAEVVQEVIATAEAGAPLDARDIGEKLAEASAQAKSQRAEERRLKRRNPKASPEEIAAKLAKRRDLADRESARRQREAEERLTRWRPIAHRMAAACGNAAADVLAALTTYPDGDAILSELKAALRSNGGAT